MMPLQGFQRRSGVLYCEDVPLEAIAAEAGTPTYVYSGSAIDANYRAYDEALAGTDHAIHYAVKANSSLAVLALLARAGAGFDIVSGGELFRVIQAGGDPRKTVFSGVGKSAEEIKYALESGLGAFNCESEGELAALRDQALRFGSQPSVALRVNPDISAETHPYISTGLSEHKFGVPFDQAEALYRDHARFAPLKLDGVSCHIGSQIFDLDAFKQALTKLLGLIDSLADSGLSIRRLDLGGGLGVGYEHGEESGSVADYGRQIRQALAGRDLELQLEPGRSIVGQAGALLTRAIYRKQNGKKVFVIVDAAMNDLIRPALYQAHHEVLPVIEAPRGEIWGDVVGPVCESGDFLARDRRMPDFQPGELLAVATAGAYGFVQASNYNSRPRAAEVLVRGASWRVIRDRETYADLVRGERV
jgi:diaminopimelate decarboxylase